MNYRNAYVPNQAPRSASPVSAKNVAGARSSATSSQQERLQPENPSTPAQRSKNNVSLRFRGTGRLAFTLVVIAFVFIGWLNRNEGYLTPEEGYGYWLGITGGSLMLLLLVYPLRKRLRLLRGIGPVAFWFRLHMIAGIIGPLLVVIHANFKFGSLNATIALTSMLLVAFSGLIGRYLYGKLHKGLYGQRAQVREILADATMFKQIFGADLQGVPEISQQMQLYERRLLKPIHSLLPGIWSMILMRSETKRCQARLKRNARKSLAARAQQGGWSRA